MVEVVDRFATSEERCAILAGLFELRRALRELGLSPGFQWLDGSFCEDVEDNEQRAPRDIDVVSFVPLGAEQAALVSAAPEMFNPVSSKERWRVDHYVVDTSLPLDAEGARRVAYWSSIWSHTRLGAWKGFVEVDSRRMAR